jgi:predicted amidohydrolase
MLAFVALAQHGVLNVREMENLKFADPDGAQSVTDSPNVGVGIKIRSQEGRR